MLSQEEQSGRLLRRPQQDHPAAPVADFCTAAYTQPVLTVHDLTLDLLSRIARRQGQVVELQAKEFALLEILMRNAGRVVTRTMLLEQVWNFNFEPNTTVVETHVSRLRAKIDKPFDLPLIHTVRSTGYSMHGPR